MLYKVREISLIRKMVLYCGEEDEIELTNLLKKQQKDIFKEIEILKFDPRCVDAYKFCLLYCSIALERAEKLQEMKFKKIPKMINFDMLNNC